MVKKQKDKIFELTIEDQDELSGVDSISLVDDPAIMINWVAFKRVSQDFHIPENEDNSYLEKLIPLGQSEDELLAEGFEVEEIIYPHQEKFIYATPNAPSELDDEFFRYRYKYVKNPQASGPSVKKTTRDFCRELVSRNLVFRIEDMLDQQNYEGSSFADWRGGYNCRHIFVKVVYKKKGKVTDSGGVKDGYDILGDPQNDTRTNNPSFKKVAEKEEEEMGYDVGSIGGYVDPDIKKKKKKKLDDEENAPEVVGPFDYLKPQKHSKQAFAADEEKQIVLGPAMVPDMKIFRKDELGNPYYVYFTTDTIKQIADKYMKNKYTDNNDMMHNGKAVPDVFVTESWIKESNNDKSTDYGFGDLPVGTWFVSMKINNPEIWNKIKNHQLNGFSVSGYFAEEPANFMSKEEMFLYQVVEILKSSEK